MTMLRFTLFLQANFLLENSSLRNMDENASFTTTHKGMSIHRVFSSYIMLILNILIDKTSMILYQNLRVIFRAR